MLIVGYKKVDNEAACCISNFQYHQGCTCNGLSKICKTSCDEDINCRGYVNSTYGICLIATTSSCHIDCVDFSIGNVGELMDGATCGNASGWRGCSIKQGK